MQELFKEIPLYLPVKNPDDYKNKYPTTINPLGGYWFIENINTNLPSIKKRQLINNKVEERR